MAKPALREYAKESIPIIVAECFSSGVKMPAQIAYILATSEHESNCGKFMRELWGPTKTQKGYEWRKDLGNTHKGDGFRFRGRGYVQITGRANYTYWAKRLFQPIVDEPDLVAKDRDIAAKILVQGMRDGTFRPAKGVLSDFIQPGEHDFFNARELINGDKNRIPKPGEPSIGEKIAGYARNYLAAWRSLSV